MICDHDDSDASADGSSERRKFCVSFVLKSKVGGRDENEIITLNILMYSSTQPLLLLSGVGRGGGGSRGLGGTRGRIPYVKIVTRIMKQWRG